jgi:hypothetical protein
MKSSAFARLATLFTSVVITVVIVGSIALLGHPHMDAAASLAHTKAPARA